MGPLAPFWISPQKNGPNEIIHQNHRCVRILRCVVHSKLVQRINGTHLGKHYLGKSIGRVKWVLEHCCEEKYFEYHNGNYRRKNGLIVQRPAMGTVRLDEEFRYEKRPQKPSYKNLALRG